MTPIEIRADEHSWRDIIAIADGTPVRLSGAVRDTLARYRQAVEAIAARGDRVYGITTGLGALSDVLLSKDEIVALSTNTVRSHSVAVGEPLPNRCVRAIMAAQIMNYRHGHSGISPAVVEQIVALLNAGITPVVPRQGSVGWIAHTAFIATALIGEGMVSDNGTVKPAADALRAHGLSPVTLGAKDGLSLINGSPCMVGLGSIVMEAATRLVDWADLIAAMSFEILGGQIAAYDPAVMTAKRHASVAQVGARLRSFLDGSAIVAANKGRRTQDALSIRSVPQIHGGIRDALAYAAARLDDEANAATDNPLVFLDQAEPRIVSQANPHAEGLALAIDMVAIALTELGGVAERRVDRLVNPLVSGLPPFLVMKPGVNSGFMIVQYTAASIASENKILAHPASVDNFTTSGQQEDHLSLGTPGALKALTVAMNVQKILGIEYLCAAQAFEFREGHQPGRGTGAAYAHLRQAVSAYDTDRILNPDMEAAISLLDAPCPVSA
jgi:histidine ammonia-lyase